MNYHKWRNTFSNISPSISWILYITKTLILNGPWISIFRANVPQKYFSRKKNPKGTLWKFKQLNSVSVFITVCPIGLKFYCGRFISKGEKIWPILKQNNFFFLKKRTAPLAILRVFEQWKELIFRRCRWFA